jgi:hypothetical protein
MRKIVLVALATLSCSVLSAQFRLKNEADQLLFSADLLTWISDDSQPPLAVSTSGVPEAALSQALVANFLCAMESGSAVDLKANCTPDMVYRTEMTDQSGKVTTFEESVDAIADFSLQSSGNFGIHFEYGTPHTTKGGLLKPYLSVSTAYTFLLNQQTTHCGTLTFDMVKTEAGWRIKSITDAHLRACE